MNREIKFKAWDIQAKQIRSWDYLKETVTFGGPIAQLFERPNLIIPLQYTGLKDKNGKEIYEGDLLKHDLWGLSEIIWEHGMFRGIGQGHDHDVTLSDHQLQRSKIVGNIYKNSDLLT